MKAKLLIPFLLLCLFIFTPTTSFAAATHQVKHSSASIAVRPNINGTTNCNNSNFVEIFYNYGQNEECFGGDGYLGLGSTSIGNLYNVTYFHSGNNCGWIRSYTSSGAGSNPTFNSGGVYGNNTYVINYKVTQIDIQGQNCVGTH